MKTFYLLLFALLFITEIYAQTIETVIKKLPPHFYILTTWGLRPEWDEKGENIYFLNKMVGDVFKINIKTREITCVTSGFYHAGIFRVLCLKNGDLLLGIGGKDFDPAKPEKHRYNLEMHILKKDDLKNPISLGEFMDEGPAVSRNNMKIAWTLFGQREIVMADIDYSNGIPKLVNKKSIVNSSYRMPHLYFIILISKLLHKNRKSNDLESDLKELPVWLNKLLFNFGRLENWWLKRGFSLPVGSSLFIVAKKNQLIVD